MYVQWASCDSSSLNVTRGVRQGGRQTKVILIYMDALSDQLNNSNIYTINLLKYVACRSQFLLDRRRRCLKPFVPTESTSSYEFTFQFGLAIFFIGEKTHKLAETVSPERVFILINQPANIECQRPVEKDRHG